MLQDNAAYDKYQDEIAEAYGNVADASDFGETNPFFHSEQPDTGGRSWEELEAEAVEADTAPRFKSSLVETEAEEEN